MRDLLEWVVAVRSTDQQHQRMEKLYHQHTCLGTTALDFQKRFLIRHFKRLHCLQSLRAKCKLKGGEGSVMRGTDEMIAPNKREVIILTLLASYRRNLSRIPCLIGYV